MFLDKKKKQIKNKNNNVKLWNEVIKNDYVHQDIYHLYPLHPIQGYVGLKERFPVSWWQKAEKV